MPYAITLPLDSQAESKVVAMYAALASLNISHDQIKLGYPPHITLAILDDATKLRELNEVVSNVARSWQSLRLSFVGFGLFPGAPSTLWLCPVVTADLLQRHAALCAALPVSSLTNHYLPNRWVPHVTLAKDVTEPSAAFAAMEGLDLPTEATFAEVNLIHFRPVKLICRLRLKTFDENHP